MIPTPYPSLIIETCDQGHKFAKLEDHPIRDGKARCPHCLAIGFDRVREENLVLRNEVGILTSALRDSTADIASQTTEACKQGWQDAMETAANKIQRDFPGFPTDTRQSFATWLRSIEPYSFPNRKPSPNDNS